MQAIHQNSFYKTQLGEFLRCDVAECAEQDKLREALACWESEQASFDDMEQWLPLIPGWCETLRASTVKKVVQSVASALQNLVASFQEILTEKFERQTEDERKVFIELLRRSSEAITNLAKNLQGKEASLVSLSHKARDLFTSASTAHQQHTHSEALQHMIDYQDWNGHADADTFEIEKAFVTVVSAENTCPLTPQLTELCQQGVLIVAGKVLSCTGADISADDLQHSRSLLTAGQKLHRRLGTAAHSELRQACLEVASAHLQLKDFLVKAGKPDAFMAHHGENVLPQSIHLNSLLQRCSDIRESSSTAPKTEEGKEAIQKLCEMSGELVTQATTFRQHLADSVHAQTMKQVQANLQAAKALVGDRGNSNGQPLWSLRLTRESSWPEVQKESAKSLQREGYGEKVKALQTKLVADCFGLKRVSHTLPPLSQTEL